MADEDDHEREQVEHVFGLTGGELNDAPWVVQYDDGDECTFRYTYDGVPDWAGSDFEDSYDTSRYVTVVSWWETPEWLTDKEGQLWHRARSYTSGGEVECPEREGEASFWFGMENCPLCDALPGDKHGYIYLGDGWGETVYARYSSAKQLGVERGEETGRRAPNGEDWKWFAEQDTEDRYGSEFEKHAAALVEFADGMKEGGDEDCLCPEPCVVHGPEEGEEDE